MPVSEYLKQVNKRFLAGNATEHSYRADLQNLILEIVQGINVTNEPKHQECGAPDYIIQKKEVPLGYIEAKDIDADLDKVEKTDQLKRYLASLDNLILTNYIEFRFYKYSQKVHTIKIAEIDRNKIKPITDTFDFFITHIKDFCSFKGQTIKSAQKLAQMMAQKARMMEEILYNVVKEENADNTLKDQLAAFKKILIHDLDEMKFADIYAQTIAYGLFAARLNDTSLEDFSRQEARELIPKSNPFLRNLFDYISGAQLDERVIWIVSDLADIFRATDIKELLKDFGKSTGQTDPFIHFYETFLAEYDPKLRKSRGVYYTPEPVVNFIVRAVDDILKSEFGINDGLADTKTIKIKRSTGTSITKGKHRGREAFEEVIVHKVQILDPAAGTGTFLAEVVRQIYKKFEGQSGVWSNYVEEHLLPRLNGFEILMAPYTMCHLKLDLLLNETGYKSKTDERLRVFLTNSLEEVHPDTGTLFIRWLSDEASEANIVKRDTPVMVVIGNPPYSGESQNKGEWIMNLMEDYKKEPGGKEQLKERNPKWINDDYVKFLRYGQHLIEKNKEGILAFINPHGFLDNPTFRGMRWNLLKTYDKLYIIDLHGNSKKKEKCPDGSKDVNVFDIMQGVSINIFVKTIRKNNDTLGTVLHYDLYGLREDKYNYLFQKNIRTVPYEEIPPIPPKFYLVKKDFNEEKVYSEGFFIPDLFKTNSVGITTARDAFTIHFSKDEVKKTVQEFISLGIEEARIKFKLGSDARDWKVEYAKNDLIKSGLDFKHITQIYYRPFDERYTYYTGNSKGFHCMPRGEVMGHFLRGENIGISLTRRIEGDRDFNDIFVFNRIIQHHSLSIKEVNNIFPLYLYPENVDQTTIVISKREPNLNNEIVKEIADKLDLIFTPELENGKNNIAPIDILDYIYAVLHSPSYRENFSQFLKDDFPRVPYPTDKETFRQLVKLGGELRTIHLLENPVVDKPITNYPVAGNNEVQKVEYKDGNVFINKDQYFEGVGKTAWEFYIGGYQPAQKWLKDRKDRKLNYDDIKHYQKIIVALVETNRIMKEIDEIIDI